MVVRVVEVAGIVDVIAGLAGGVVVAAVAAAAVAVAAADAAVDVAVAVAVAGIAESCVPPSLQSIQESRPLQGDQTRQGRC